MIIPSKTSRLDHRRVVVTGLGVVSSLGIGWQEFWENLIAGKSGISRVTSFDTSQYERHYAGEVKNFDPTQFMNQGKAKKIGRTSQFAVVASQLALTDAELNLDDLSAKNVAVCIGTTSGEIGLLEKFGDACFEKSKTPFPNNHITTFPSSSLSSHVAYEFKLQGRNSVFSNACASGNYALGQAFDLIRTGKTDFAFAGGSDGMSRIVYTGFGRLFAIAPEKCQPFDKDRKGMIPGEGAGVLLVESLENALKRKASIYAEILGYGISCDAQHMTIPSPAGIAKAIKRSLENSNISAEAVDYISAHGTGTVENDKAECDGARSVFGERIKEIPMSSIKSMLGHTMGAAAAFESIACCLAITENKVPPTINLEELDKDCNIDCVPNNGRRHNVKIALNNSQAFGGSNVGVVLKNC